MDEEIVKKLELFPCNYCTKACLSLPLLKIHQNENHLSEILKRKQKTKEPQKQNNKKPKTTQQRGSGNKNNNNISTSNKRKGCTTTTATLSGTRAKKESRIQLEQQIIIKNDDVVDENEDSAADHPDANGHGTKTKTTPATPPTKKKSMTNMKGTKITSGEMEIRAEDQISIVESDKTDKNSNLPTTTISDKKSKSPKKSNSSSSSSNPSTDTDSGFIESISVSENSLGSTTTPTMDEEHSMSLSESQALGLPDESDGGSGLPPSSSRLMRNLAEKMRRDKLNMYISELSSLVPIVAQATKRMDKTSVLRLSANFLRIHMSLQNNPARTPTKMVIPEALEHSLSSTLLDAIEGFMLIVTSSGKIVYVSESIEKLLGHSQLDLMGQSLYTITHNGDTELLRHHLQPQPSSEFSASDPEFDFEEAGCSSDDYVPRSPSFFGGKPEDALSGLASGERRSFYVRLAERSMARGDPARHVQVHMIGLLRPPENAKKEKPLGKGKKDSGGPADEHLMVCVARPLRNKGIGELSLMESVQDEYVTRHLPDGRIIYSDHRIAFVAGYLTEEVMGLSAFEFICQQDLPWATVANRQMFSSVEGQGYSVYRLRSKTGALIHLRTRGFLEFNKTTQKVETFVCINTLLPNEDGDKELEKERERITPFLTFQQVTTTTTSTNAAPAGGGGGGGAEGLLAIEASDSIPLALPGSSNGHPTMHLLSPRTSVDELDSSPPAGSILEPLPFHSQLGQIITTTTIISGTTNFSQLHSQMDRGNSPSHIVELSPGGGEDEELNLSNGPVGLGMVDQLLGVDPSSLSSSSPATNHILLSSPSASSPIRTRHESSDQFLTTISHPHHLLLDPTTQLIYQSPPHHHEYLNSTNGVQSPLVTPPKPHKTPKKRTLAEADPEGEAEMFQNHLSFSGSLGSPNSAKRIQSSPPHLQQLQIPTSPTGIGGSPSPSSAIFTSYTTNHSPIPLLNHSPNPQYHPPPQLLGKWGLEPSLIPLNHHHHQILNTHAHPHSHTLPSSSMIYDQHNNNG